MICWILQVLQEIQELSFRLTERMIPEDMINLEVVSLMSLCTVFHLSGFPGYAPICDQ